MTCHDCGANYTHSDDSCTARFDQLLALDHSWREPWGSRHGLAFAAFALQHPSRYDVATVARAHELLTRVIERGEPLGVAVRDFRARIASGQTTGASAETPAEAAAWTLPPRNSTAFATTIADLGEFAADGYAEQLESWCRAALRGYSA